MSKFEENKGRLDGKTFTLQLEGKASPEAAEFFLRLTEDFDAAQQTMQERVDELFSKTVSIGGNEKDIMIAKNLFTIGYVLGWNDSQSVKKGERK